MTASTHLTRESRGFVVRGEFAVPAKGDRPASTHHSWWYGPHRLMNGWGSLDYSVHVFPTRRAASDAVAERIGSSRSIDIFSVQEAVAVAIEEAKSRRETAVAEGRTTHAMSWTETIKQLRGLER